MCSNWLDNNICTVIIGDGEIKEKIGVHENLLLYKSPYFRRILKASNKAELGEIFLNDVDVRLFKLLVRWMYGTALGRVFRYGLPDAEVSVHDYIGLYVLASQLEIPAAKNCIMDTIYNYYAEDVPELRCPAVADLRMVMDNLPEDSPLERLLTAHLLFTCFSTKRDGASVPDDWILIRESGRIGYGLITMLTEWKWLLGRNVPPMKIRDRHHFHEKLDAPPVGSRSQIRVVIKAEPGTDGSDQPQPQLQPTPAPRPTREPVAEQDFSAVARAAKRPADTQHPDADGGAQGPSSSAPASSLRPAKRPAYRKGAAIVRAAAAAAAAATANPAAGAAKGPLPNGSPEDPISL
ncbi:hypothetical protein B0T18DRAFT_330633 [Schizothecium vesticola]|uniref:BTB domain-containing protein n=1 Tax=Schizothecium vesticola TaxID=314040 RepID=A0AA40EJ58_9PEZI|nr:hypothetical protein B0T18DRAFT_330633 [Schizothecium vesticola]